jgi:dynamin 1-like protein
LDDDDIRTAIANANGPRPSLFVPEMSFDLLVRRQIARLEQPGLQCVDLVFDEMQRMSFQSETTELCRFPELRDRVFEKVNQVLRNCVIPTQKMISNLIQIELAYINTSHPDFIGGKQAVSQINRKNSQNQESVKVSSNPISNSNSCEITQSNIQSNVSGNVKANIVNNSSSSSSSVSTVVNMPAPPSIIATNSSNNNTENNQSRNGNGFFNLFRPTGADNKDKNNSNHSSSSSVSAHNNMKESGLVKLSQVPDKMRSGGNISDRERVETEIIKSLIGSYFDIVKKNYMDLVPKTIMHFLVNTFKDGLQNELVSELYKETMLGNLMKETEDIASRRKACREMKELLQRALEIVNEVRDFNTFK